MFPVRQWSHWFRNGGAIVAQVLLGASYFAIVGILLLLVHEQWLGTFDQVQMRLASVSV